MGSNLRTVAALAVGAVALLGFSATVTASVAAPARPAVSSFVGNYTFHVTIDGHSHVGPVAIKADGTAIDKTGNVAHWTSSGKTITITYSDKTTSEKWVGTQSKKGISTKKHPGTVTITGVGTGTFYGIKTS